MRSLDILRSVAMFVVLAAGVQRDAGALESRSLRQGEVDYRVVTLDLRRDVLELDWLGDDGRAYGGIEALRQAGERSGRKLLFATNAGIYDREYRPLGLTIADGKVLRPLNTSQGRSGNFGLQPNGVFYVDRLGEAGIATTAAWRERSIDARVATQSGPMLVIDGALNANFDEASDSRKWRSGVCVTSPQQVVFVVSEVPVTFHAFARVFRDALGCRDALYLDGTLSQIYTAADGFSGAPAMMVKPYAGMLAVFSGEPPP